MKNKDTKILDFISIMIDKGHEKDIVPTLIYFQGLVREYRNIGYASVVSAQMLTTDERDKIKAKLIETTSYDDFIVDYNVDDSLICGMQIKVGDKMCDSSFKTKLETISKSLRGIRV